MIVNIQIKNATTKTLGLSLANDKTAITDEQEHSFEPSTGGWADWVSPNPDVLPGAAVDFASVFQVPKDTKIKDLVFDLTDSRTPGHTIFRIHLN